MSTLTDYAVHPGEYLAEWMESAEINAAELSRKLGVTPKHVSELLSGKVALTAELAARLELATGVPARLWNRYESQFRQDTARLATSVELEALYDQAERFPLAYLRKAGVVTATKRNKAQVVQELLQFLGAADFNAWRATWSQGSVAYRKAVVGRADAEAMAAWLTFGEREAHLVELPPYSRQAVLDLIPSLRSTTAGLPERCVDEAVGALRRCGVAVCFVQPIPGSGVYGATRWVNRRPVVQLSLRGKSNDQLWFTLFHELGHVLLHGPQGIYLQGEDSEAEREANDFASETLIPREYAARLPVRPDVDAVERLAEELGIAPAIVLGQAQRAMKDFTWGNHLKIRYQFAATEVD